MKSALAVAIVTSIFATVVPAQARGDEPSAVDLVIQRLSDSNPAKADAAMVALIRGGTASEPVLRAALKRCRETRFVERAERALALCEVDARPVGGLKLGLKADKATLGRDEGVSFTATLCNVSDEVIVVYVGMSYSGNVFQNGLALSRVPVARDGEVVPARFGAVGFCGTGARPLVVEIAPWSFHRFEIKARYRTERSENSLAREDGPHLEMGYVYLPIAERERGLRIRLQHTVGGTPEGMVKPDKIPDWRGRVVSNEVVIRAKGV